MKNQMDPFMKNNGQEAQVIPHQDIHSLILQEPPTHQRGFCSSDLMVGSRVRIYRKQLGLSIRSLAEKCGISVNTLSLIENNRTYPNVYTLKLLADGLGMPVVSFFEEEKLEPTMIYQKQGQRVKSHFSNGTLEKLGQGLPSLGAEPILVTLETVKSEVPLISHVGREFIYCLDGVVACEFEHKSYLLSVGDSLLFNAAFPHRWINAQPSLSKLLVIFCAIEANEPLAELHWKS